MLQFLDYFLTLFHSLFVLFVVFGWIPKTTRTAHIGALGLTLTAWLLLGIWYGLGYCPLTDWHWDVKRALGEHHLPNSFTKYIFDQITGLNTNKGVIDAVTGLGLIFGIIMAAIKYWHKQKLSRGK